MTPFVLGFCLWENNCYTRVRGIGRDWNDESTGLAMVSKAKLTTELLPSVSTRAPSVLEKLKTFLIFCAGVIIEDE